MRFTRNPAKAGKNEQLHGLSFTRAAQILDRPKQVGENCWMDETGEQRFQIIGMAPNLVLLVVFFESGAKGS